MKHTSRPIQAGSAPEVESLKPRSRWWMGVTTGVPRAGGIALAIMRGEMPTAHSACLKNCRFPARGLPERGRWMVPPIAEAVHRLPPSRMSLALGRGAASGTALRSYVDRFRGQADVPGWQAGDRPEQAHEHSSTAALLSVGGAFM